MRKLLFLVLMVVSLVVVDFSGCWILWV